MQKLEAPSEDPILQFLTTGVQNQWFRVTLIFISIKYNVTQVNFFQIILYHYDIK
jgi:hypothetical protein